MKMSVISPVFQEKYIKDGILEGSAIVFDGPEEYHANINNPILGITENSILIMRGCGSVGYPGSAEVVNMIPPDYLIQKGISELPCIGDGRQSGTSASPSILNASPEAAVGGGLAYLQNGDTIRIDLNARTVNALVPEDEWNHRKVNTPLPHLKHNSMYVEMFRNRVTQLGEGAYFKGIEDYKNLSEAELRHSH